MQKCNKQNAQTNKCNKYNKQTKTLRKTTQINTLLLYFYVPARVYPNVLVFFNVKAPPKPTAVRVDENKKELEQNI